MTRQAIEAIEDARDALREREIALADRYLQKALEQLWCMICHEPVQPDERDVEPYFKGYVHAKCQEKYGGRGKYLHEQKIGTDIGELNDTS